MPTRETSPEREALARARAATLALAADVRALEARARSIARELRAAGASAEPVATLEGERYTVADWMADELDGGPADGVAHSLEAAALEAFAAATGDTAAELAAFLTSERALLRRRAERRGERRTDPAPTSPPPARRSGRGGAAVAQSEGRET